MQPLGLYVYLISVNPYNFQKTSEQAQYLLADILEIFNFFLYVSHKEETNE